MTAEIIPLPIRWRVRMIYNRDRPDFPFSVLYERSPAIVPLTTDFDDYNPALAFARRLNPDFDGHYYVVEDRHVVGFGSSSPTAA